MRRLWSLRVKNDDDLTALTAVRGFSDQPSRAEAGLGIYFGDVSTAQAALFWLFLCCGHRQLPC
jgi:hypothetical protein